jgi:uncharacterized protein with von Willebrand factor type A (vWA) domain
MKRYIYRYSRWDGSQELDLEYKAMLDDFLERFLQTGDVSAALEWMMHEGIRFDFKNQRFEGLERLLSKLAQRRSRMLNQFNTRGLVDELLKRLQEIVNKELAAIEAEEQAAGLDYSMTGSEASRHRMQELFEQESRLRGLPENLSQAVNQLKGHSFTSPEAEQEFQEFLEMMQALSELAARNFFRGDQPLSIEQALQIEKELKRLDDLIRAIERGDLEGINLDDLARFLGEEARKGIEQFLQFMEFLKESGFIAEQDGDLMLTPKAMQTIGQKALRDIFSLISPGGMGPHQTARTGPGTPLPDQSREWRFGDPLTLHLPRTLINAVKRTCAEKGPLFSGQAKGDRPALRLAPEDFEILEVEFQSNSATVLMLDMSLSMFQGGRFTAAKKVALALDHLIRSRFPKDYFYLVGFATRAKRLSRRELIEASGGLGEDVFTNIQDALQLADKLLAPHRQCTRQIILITDGQPTAFTKAGKFYIEWPYFGISPNASRETLKEVRRTSRQNITINTFMLDRDPPLVRFVEEMTHINKGRAFFTAPDQLGRYILLDYLAKKKRVIH